MPALQVITAERSLFFLVNLHYAPQIAALDEKWSQRSGTFAPLLRWLLSTSHTGVAPLYILINAAAAAVLVWMPYTILVEFSMLLSVPSVCLFMWSFVALRVQRPDVPRRFLIPGGLSVAIAVTVIPVAISISYAAIILTESAIGDGDTGAATRTEDLPPIYQVYCMALVILVGFAGHGVARYCARRGLDGAKAGGSAPAVAMGAALGSPGPPGDGEGSGLLNGGGNTPCGGFREVELTSTGRKPKSGSASPLQEKFSRVVSSCLPSQRDNGYSRVGLTDE